MVKVTVQWGKQTLKDVEVDTAQKGKDFKLKLKELTGVPAERQTIMGLVPGLLKDEADLSKVKIREGQIIKLLGSAEAVPEAPKEKVVFAEDLVDEDNAAALMQQLPVGLTNLGNTCYANSSLQCLRMIPELRDAIEKFAGATNAGDSQHNITVHLRDLYKKLETSHDALAPGSFITAFREAYPQFAEKTSSPLGEIYAQQDADEFVGNVIQVLQQKLDSSKESQNLVGGLFRGEFETQLKCAEADEQPTTTTESFTRLSCFIEQQTNNLIYGLAQSLTGTVEKQSPSLQRSAVYQKTQKIKKLPSYLIVNFVRFFWKSKQQVKAKILRDVKFPIVLDTLDLCSEELKEELKPTRETLRKEKEQQVMAKFKEPKKEESATTTASSSAAGEKMEIEGASSSTVATTQVNTPTGWYELCGVVTHKGRTADSGHYIGWVKDSKGRWIKFDDDKVYEVSEEEIKKLSGGGDWHTAYLLFYRTMKTAP